MGLRRHARVEPPLRRPRPTRTGTQLLAVARGGPSGRFRAPACGHGYAWAMRTMFTVYVLVIVTGLALYTAVGLAHL